MVRIFSHCFPGRTFAAIERENIEKDLQEKLQHLLQEAEVCIHFLFCMHAWSLYNRIG